MHEILGNNYFSRPQKLFKMLSTSSIQEIDLYQQFRISRSEINITRYFPSNKNALAFKIYGDLKGSILLFHDMEDKDLAAEVGNILIGRQLTCLEEQDMLSVISSHKHYLTCHKNIQKLEEHGPYFSIAYDIESKFEVSQFYMVYIVSENKGKDI